LRCRLHGGESQNSCRCAMNVCMKISVRHRGRRRCVVPNTALATRPSVLRNGFNKVLATRIAAIGSPRIRMLTSSFCGLGIPTLTRCGLGITKAVQRPFVQQLQGWSEGVLPEST
jgi:hypothetical protein